MRRRPGSRHRHTRSRAATPPIYYHITTVIKLAAVVACRTCHWHSDATFTRGLCRRYVRRIFLETLAGTRDQVTRHQSLWMAKNWKKKKEKCIVRKKTNASC